MSGGFFFFFFFFFFSAFFDDQWALWGVITERVTLHEERSFGVLFWFAIDRIKRCGTEVKLATEEFQEEIRIEVQANEFISPSPKRQTAGERSYS